MSLVIYVFAACTTTLALGVVAVVLGRARAGRRFGSQIRAAGEAEWPVRHRRVDALVERRAA